jgi:hypothetical protein
MSDVDLISGLHDIAMGMDIPDLVLDAARRIRELKAELQDVKSLAWTADLPTVPGHYLCAYRWDSDSPWVTNYIRIAGSPVDPDISDTRWFGPIPAIEPAKGGGG